MPFIELTWTQYIMSVGISFNHNTISFFWKVNLANLWAMPLQFLEMCWALKFWKFFFFFPEFQRSTRRFQPYCLSSCLLVQLLPIYPLQICSNNIVMHLLKIDNKSLIICIFNNKYQYVDKKLFSRKSLNRNIKYLFIKYVILYRKIIIYYENIFCIFHSQWWHSNSIIINVYKLILVRESS